MPSSVSSSPDNHAGASQAERAYLALRDEIVSLHLPPGTPVHEEALTDRLGIGRAPSAKR